MFVYEVGKPYPHHNRANGTERPVSELNSAFFDVLLYSLDPEADKEFWKKGQLKYAVFIAHTIPFFIIDFPKDEFNFDVSINFLKVQEDKADEWLNSKSNIINLYLINARNNNIEAMRMISVAQSAADLIRDACEKQDEEYKSWEEVESKITIVSSKYATGDMLKISKTYKS